ncbi:MAG: hypothetical protein WC451_03115 [Patescibacteria group bacterium]|jgi:hypothetical protein
MMEENCPAHSGIINDIRNLKDSEERQWDIIDKLQNRLPVWATLTISLLTFLLGASLSYTIT